MDAANKALYQAFSKNYTDTATAQQQVYLCNPAVLNSSSSMYQLRVGAAACPFSGALQGAPAAVTFNVSLGQFNSTYRGLRCANDNTLGCYLSSQIPAAAYDAYVLQALVGQVLTLGAPLAEDLLLCNFVERTYDDLGTYFCDNARNDMQIFFGGFFLYASAYFPMFVILVIGYHRFRPACFDTGRGQVDSEKGEDGGQFAVHGVMMPPQDPAKGEQLGNYAANHGY